MAQEEMARKIVATTYPVLKHHAPTGSAGIDRASANSPVVTYWHPG